MSSDLGKLKQDLSAYKGDARPYALEAILPSPTNRREAAIQGMVRRQLLSKKAQPCIEEQARYVQKVPEVPYNLPQASCVRAEFLRRSLAKLSKNQQAFEAPFIDYLKAGRILEYTKAMLDFEPLPLNISTALDLVEELLSCKRALQELDPNSHWGEIKTAIELSEKDLDPCIGAIDKALHRLYDTKYPPGPDFTYGELIAYQRELLQEGEACHLDKSVSKFKHSISLDPEKGLFYIHTEKTKAVFFLKEVLCTLQVREFSTYDDLAIRQEFSHVLGVQAPPQFVCQTQRKDMHGYFENFWISIEAPLGPKLGKAADTLIVLLKVAKTLELMHEKGCVHGHIDEEHISQQGTIHNFRLAPRAYHSQREEVQAFGALMKRLYYPEEFAVPKTLREKALQELILSCLSQKPPSAKEIAYSLEEVQQAAPTPYIAIERKKSWDDEFRYYALLKQERMGQRKGGPVKRSFRRASSSLRVGKQNTGNRSLPPEVFSLFADAGQLSEHMKRAETQFREEFLRQALPLDRIRAAGQELDLIQGTLIALEKVVDRFRVDHREAIKQHEESLQDFRQRLNSLYTDLLAAKILGAEPLTWGNYQRLEEYRNRNFRKLKSEAGYIEHQNWKVRLAHHFDKHETGLPFALSYVPWDKTLIVHIKVKRGKGAVKSVHALLRFQNGQILQDRADVVMRMTDFDMAEEMLKSHFSDCPFIEASSQLAILYSKKEIPGLWKKKKDLSVDEIQQVYESGESQVVEKIAFFPPLYSGSLGDFSYKLGANRDISFICNAFKGAAKGLLRMHEDGYIHRDLKPGNILILGQDGVIADLGEAVLASRVSNMAGTLHYNSPETCLEKKDPLYQKQSFASDIWAFGLTMLQALYGAHGRDIPFFDPDSKLHIFAQLQELKQSDVEASLDKRFPNPSSREEATCQKAIRSCLQVLTKLRIDSKGLVQMLTSDVDVDLALPNVNF